MCKSSTHVSVRIAGIYLFLFTIWAYKPLINQPWYVTNFKSNILNLILIQGLIFQKTKEVIVRRPARSFKLWLLISYQDTVISESSSIPFSKVSRDKKIAWTLHADLTKFSQRLMKIRKAYNISGKRLNLSDSSKTHSN